MDRVTGRHPRPATTKAAIRGRLKRFLKARGGVYPLYAHGPFRKGTVGNWMAGNKSLPSLEQTAKLTRKTGLSLDWLVTGEGPELRGATTPLADVAQALRSHVAAATIPEFGLVAGAALPRAEIMLGEVVESYRRRIAAVVRDFRRRK